MPAQPMYVPQPYAVQQYGGPMMGGYAAVQQPMGPPPGYGAPPPPGVAFGGAPWGASAYGAGAAPPWGVPYGVYGAPYGACGVPTCTASTPCAGHRG